MSLQFSINILDQLQTCQISLVGQKILQCHQGMTKITPFKKFNFVLDTDTVCVNKALKTEYFPDSLNYPNVRPVYKKVDLFWWKPVSILPLLLKSDIPASIKLF